MTFRNPSFALAIFLGSWVAACGGSTTIEFVGDDNTGGDSMGGGDADGGNQGDGGGTADGGTDVGGMGGDGSGGGAIVTAPYCGDGSIDEDNEACDDGNERSGDGCSSACEVEDPFVCSGEPSECSTVGNGSLDDGEECEDGNADDGDGCSSTGTVEGTCDAPEPLVLVDGGFGTSVATVTANTTAGGASAGAAACGGLSLGGGTDRVYELELTSGSDFTLTVESDFDAIVRIYGAYLGPACDPANEAFCIDDVGADASETWEFPGLGIGTMYIVVDGADDGEAGEFTLTATAGCDIEHVKLHRLSVPQVVPSTSAPTYTLVSLKNTSNYCTVDLSAANLFLTDSGSFGETALPQQPLGPEQVFRGSIDVDPGVNPNAYDLELDADLNYFDAFEAGAFLCKGTCDLTASTNILDGVAIGSAVVPPGITFASLPGTGGLFHEGYARVAYDGANPGFLASDWSQAFLVDPDDFTPQFTHRIQTLTLSPLEVVADATQGTVLRVPARANNSDYSYYSAAIPSAVTNPTYISYKYKQPAYSGVAEACYLGFGIEPGAAVAVDSTSWGETLSLHYSVVEPAYSATYHLGYGTMVHDPETWHQVELTDIDYVASTLTLSVDGQVLASSVVFYKPYTITDVFSLSPFGPDSDCDYTDIIARNGPPGRIWESSPVLP